MEDEEGERGDAAAGCCDDVGDGEGDCVVSRRGGEVGEGMDGIESLKSDVRICGNAHRDGALEVISLHLKFE
jgi:hypothetical protein